MNLLVLIGLLAGGSSLALAAEAKKAADPRAAMVEQAIANADAARKKAASVKGEWRDTGKIIKKAQAAAKAGKYDDAMKLAGKAREQGELGYAQAVAQRDLRMPSYLKY
jgi:hypothetical protein